MFSDEKFIDTVSERDFPSTSEVVEGVGCKYRTAYGRLGELEDEGRIKRREIGNSLVWLTGDDE